MSQSEPVQFEPLDFSKLDIEQATQNILETALEMKASDLFLLTESAAMTVAVRRLGAVQRVASLSREQGRHLLSYIKAMSGMDISEHRRPADGRWIHDMGERIVDMRVNSVPTLHGEDMALRLWDRNLGLMGLDELGLTKHERKKLVAMLQSPSGLLLVSGPTGTGKTTSLYACLQHLNNGSLKINTLEDPVEYEINGIRQSQVNSRIDLDFSELLRSVLRQAPDVIMIGEIRDHETATTAVRAANSGHLVLATLHAPVAASAVQSMLALGANPYYLSSCILGVVAQRLIRTLCPTCRVFYDMSDATETFSEIKSLLEPGQGNAIFGPSGCQDCYELGYSGRTGLFEVLTVNPEIRKLITSSAQSEEIQGAAIKAGMVEFRRGALLKVAQGVTSTEEILRDVPAEHLGLD